MDPTDYLQAWQCIGCGRIEAPQPCVGICQDRKVLLVDANELEAALARTLRAEARTQALEALLRRLASTTPHAGRWEASWRAMQAMAQAALDEQPVGRSSGGTAGKAAGAGVVMN